MQTSSERGIELPKYSQSIHHEAELVLLIGKTVTPNDVLTQENAMQYIRGYGAGLDLVSSSPLSKINELEPFESSKTLSAVFVV
jgi:2-keto-4-pentenoate hydratase/2-oxohepta-3-ene-1,7-dioic acid hydratase in catechol pathway